MTSAFIEIRDIKKQYGPITAVKDVTLDIRKGEFMTFLGPSGSGKSTTLYMLAGFEYPTAGDIRLNGRTLLDTPSHKRNIGMVFQRYTLFPHLTVGENVAFPLRIRRLPKADVERKVREALRLVRLEGFEDRKPALMSGGQQQRVALARALVYDPPVLLMDEPLSALDKKLREEIQFEIRRIHQETGVTILYVTHDQEEALRLSDRIAVFSQGKIDQIGSGQTLYAEPATRFVAGFIGDSNFIDTDVVSVEGSHATLALPGGRTVSGVPLHSAGPGKTAALLLRPERIDLKVGEAGAADALSGTIRDITFLGNNTDVLVDIPAGKQLSVRLPFGHPMLDGLRPALPVALSFNPATVHAFQG
ncbi:putative spermidine/putrescine transport system ATP-binding protein [Rhizobium sp. RU20A]|uniref:ABC transporter ATP-binding protein n=1 Tax=Rhizobium sp. RU20A TaxID=1907412 RepID=UPI000955F2A7|nr:ABC transporter ATP-binding protein [Rhizobium sp. RU20A]SIR29713.1 putative spermidine/putrescine transport system ATP-binding protein [Rhizobium sp. RU20A]